MDITNIIIAVALLAITAVGAYVAPAIKSRVNLDVLNRLVYTAVYAAEQLGLRNIIKDKLIYAKDYIRDALAKRHIKYNEAEITAAIEASVRQNFPKK